MCARPAPSLGCHLSPRAPHTLHQVPLLLHPTLRASSSSATPPGDSWLEVCGHFCGQAWETLLPCRPSQPRHEQGSKGAARCCVLARLTLVGIGLFTDCWVQWLLKWRERLSYDQIILVEVVGTSSPPGEERCRTLRSSYAE